MHKSNFAEIDWKDIEDVYKEMNWTWKFNKPPTIVELQTRTRKLIERCKATGCSGASNGRIFVIKDKNKNLIIGFEAPGLIKKDDIINYSKMSEALI